MSDITLLIVDIGSQGVD